MSRYQAASRGIVGGLVTFVVLLIFVFATGSTFGQRCAKAFPSDPARAELCLYNLSHGDRP